MRKIGERNKRLKKQSSSFLSFFLIGKIPASASRLSFFLFLRESSQPPFHASEKWRTGFLFSFVKKNGNRKKNGGNEEMGK